jgi:hypothetical protein
MTSSIPALMAPAAKRRLLDHDMLFRLYQMGQKHLVVLRAVGADSSAEQQLLEAIHREGVLNRVLARGETT